MRHIVLERIGVGAKIDGDNPSGTPNDSKGVDGYGFARAGHLGRPGRLRYAEMARAPAEVHHSFNGGYNEPDLRRDVSTLAWDDATRSGR